MDDGAKAKLMAQKEQASKRPIDSDPLYIQLSERAATAQAKLAQSEQENRTLKKTIKAHEEELAQLRKLVSAKIIKVVFSKSAK